MSGSVLAALKVVLGLDTGPFQRGATEAQVESRRMVKSIEATGKKMMTIGAGMTAAITAPFAGLVAAAIPAARESAEAIGQVKAAIDSMGPVAQRTTEQLQNQATALQNISTFDDDDILRNVTANMLTFGEVSGQNFDRAQKAAVDLATRLKMDLQPATLLVGKALNDPVKGMAAMGRAGIQFSDSQKAMIAQMVAVGDKAGAQKIILAELEKQFGGSAQAMRDATPDAALKNSWDTLKEAIGKIALDVLPKLLPPLTRALDAFNNLSPGTQTAIVGFVGFVAVIGPIVGTVGGLVTAFATVGPPLLAAAGAVATFAGGLSTILLPTISSLAAAAAPAIAGFMAALAPILLPLAAVAAAAAAIYYAWKNWDKIKPIIDKLWNDISGWWTANVSPIFDAVGKKIMAVVDIFKDYFGAQIKNVIDGVSALFHGDFAGAFNALKGIVTAPIKAVLAVIDTLVPGAVDTIKRLASSFASGLGELAGRMLTFGRNIIDGLVRGIMAAPEKVWNALKSIVLAGVENIRKFLRINSPSLLFMEMGGSVTDGMALGIEDGTGTVDDAMQKLGDTVANGIGPAIAKAAGAAKAATADLGEQVKATTSDVIKKFGDMAAGVIGSLGNLKDKLKNGDFFDVVLSVLDVVGAVVNAIGQIKGLSGGSGSSGGSVSIPGRASGGPVIGGMPYIVGEHRPELFIPSTSGRIEPNLDRLGRGGGGTTNVTQYFGPGADEFWGKINQGHAAAAQRGAAGGASLAIKQLQRGRQRALA